MAPLAATAELQLADRARGGDSAALVELYRRYQRPLYGHAWRMLRNESAAQDIVQEAFTRAIAAMPRTEGELKFKAWIFRIATNLCLKQLNKRGRWSRDGAEQLERAPSTNRELADPEIGRRRAEIAELVARALEQLPPRYRQILLLRELSDLSYEELAETLELDTNRVKVTLHRARARFAAQFIAARLTAEPENGNLRCKTLAALVADQGDPKAHRRALVAHLESCKQCRKREHRPTAELFALLPPVPLPQQPLAPPPLAAAAASATTTASGGLAVWFGAAALVSVGVVSAVLALSSPPEELLSIEPVTVDRPITAATVAPPPVVDEARSPSPAAQPEVKTSVKPQNNKGQTKKANGLRVKVRVVPGTATVQRGKKAFPLSKDVQLELGDLLLVKSGHSVGLLLPGDQWLTNEGRIRLDHIPRKGQPVARPITVTLLSGRIAARATKRGGGLQIHLRTGALTASHCLARQGELQLEIDEKGWGQLKSLDGYVELRGAHAGRTVPPGTQLAIEPNRAGFARRLLPAASDLRPVAASGDRPPTLRWKPVANAKGYRVRIALDAQFMKLEKSLHVSRPQVHPGALPPGKHFWQVIAHRDRSDGLPSKIYSFVVARR